MLIRWENHIYEISEVNFNTEEIIIYKDLNKLPGNNIVDVLTNDINNKSTNDRIFYIQYRNKVKKIYGLPILINYHSKSEPPKYIIKYTFHHIIENIMNKDDDFDFIIKLREFKIKRVKNI